MRRFFKLLAITLAAGILIAIITIVQAKTCFRGAESYSFFCGRGSQQLTIVRADSDAAIRKLTLKNVCGECAEYSALDIDEFLSEFGGQIIFTEELSDSVNYYCKANLPYSVQLYGEEINLHICVKADGVKVGTPIIFGGY